MKVTKPLCYTEEEQASREADSRSDKQQDRCGMAREKDDVSLLLNSVPGLQDKAGVQLGGGGPEVP